MYSLRDDSYFVDEIDDTTGSKWAHLAPNSSYRFTNDEVKQSFTLTRSIIRFEDRKNRWRYISGNEMELN
ncbi:hypothetical protein GCM10020331_087110 [Ectobacillus funiculus]